MSIDEVTEFLDVTIHWNPPEQGGRSQPVQLRADGPTSYRPHLRALGSGEYLGVAFVDGDPHLVAPGARSTCTVALIYMNTGVDYSLLVPGAHFDVMEGHRVVGRGSVTRRWTSEADWRNYGAA